MFGLSTISQVPFTTLPGGTAVIYLSLVENVGVDDASTQIFNFLQSRTEPITMDDFNSQGSIFIGTIVENLNVDDSSTQQANFLQSITEDQTLEDQEFISADFAVSRTENIGVDDVLVPYFAALESITENEIGRAHV